MAAGPGKRLNLSVLRIPSSKGDELRGRIESKIFSKVEADPSTWACSLMNYFEMTEEHVRPVPSISFETWRLLLLAPADHTKVI